MAPIPEDNQERKPSGERNTLSNPSLTPIAMDSDWSDEENEENHTDTSGYTLLPQHPQDGESEESDTETYSSGVDSHNNINGNSLVISCDIQEDAMNTEAACPYGVTDNNLPEEVLRVEAGGAAAPTVAASTADLHPDFLTKYPDGKVPSYMQVPATPSPYSRDSSWNKNRPDDILALDSAQETSILKAMSGFSLPSENVPDWAKNMSEDEWTRHILGTIKSGTSQTDNKKFVSPHQADTEISSASTSVSNQQNDMPEQTWVAQFPDS